MPGAGDVRVDEVLPCMCCDVRFVQRRCMQDGIYPCHATLHELAIRDGSDFMSESRFLDVNANCLLTCFEQRSHECLAQVAGTPGDKNGHLLKCSENGFTYFGDDVHLGIDYFGQPTLVFAPKATDVDLNHIASLSSIEKFGVPGAPVTDAGMARLHGLNDLQNLVLFSTQIGTLG